MCSCHTTTIAAAAITQPHPLYPPLSVPQAQEWLAPADGGFLEADELESTWHFKQKDIVEAVAAGAARKAFDLRLPELGPYRAAFSRAGRHLVLGGARGHLAVMEWQRQHLVCEVQVRGARV